MKKIISLLGAVSVLVSGLSSLSAHADTEHIIRFSLTEGNYGTARVNVTSKAWYSFIAVTDTREGIYMTDTMKNEGISSVIPVLTVRTNFLEKWDEESVLKLTDYDFDVSYYEVNVKSTGNTNDLPQIARSFMLNHKEVKDVYFYQAFTSGEATWTGTLTMWMKDGCTEEEHAHFQEEYQKNDAAVYNELKLKYSEQKDQISQWKAKVNTNNMTDEEIFLARKENNLPTDYEIMKPIFDFAESIAEKYEEVAVAQAEIAFTGKGGDVLKLSPTSYENAVSAWEHVGDLNQDKKINALDASKILTASAMQGAGNNAGLTTEEQQFADVNADGVFNAKDAAVILQYSANIGCGSFSGTLAEFLKSAE